MRNPAVRSGTSRRYDPAMHRRLLLLLVAALLLRAWVGEAMAGEMLAHQLHAPATQAVLAHGPDCANAAADEDDGDAASMASLHCQGCTLNALPAMALPIAPSLPAPGFDELAPRFASAEALRAHKPPIS